MTTTTVERDLRNRLEKFTNLPSMPQVVLKIRQISENPKSSVADLANCILTDHQLTGRILRMANSAYYGDWAGKVNTITHAIVLMGFRAVRNIAISMSIYGMVSSLPKRGTFDVTAFWTRSVATGVIAKFLAQRTRQAELIEAAFIAGFMHDIGQIVLAAAFPEDYAEIPVPDSADVYKMERDLMDVDHLQAGGIVAQKWNFPEDLVNVISNHHRTGQEPHVRSQEPLVDLVYLADRIYSHLVRGSAPSSKHYQAVTEQARVLIGITDEDMAELLSACREQVAEIAHDLQIDIDKEFQRGGAPDQDVLDIQQQLSSKEIQLAFLQNVTAVLLEAGSEEEILQVVCETAYRGLQMGRVIVFALQPQEAVYRGLVGFGVESQETVQAMTFSAAAGIFKHLREVGKPLSVVDDNRQVYGDLVSGKENDRLAAKAYAAVPIRILDEVQYVMFADAPRRDTPIDYESMRSLTSLANQAALSIERCQLRERLGIGNSTAKRT